MNQNSIEFGAEFAFGTPKVVGLLHPQPQPRSIAAEPAEPRGHRGRDRHLLGHNPVKRLTRHAKLSRRFAHRKAERRQDILAQYRSRMRRPPLSTIFLCSLSDHFAL